MPNPDAVQEFRVVTSNYSAEYGRTVGAVVNVITKGGTNELHGSLFHFLRNRSLNARNFFEPDTIAAGAEPVRRQRRGPDHPG